MKIINDCKTHKLYFLITTMETHVLSFHLKASHSHNIPNILQKCVDTLHFAFKSGENLSPTLTIMDTIPKWGVAMTMLVASTEKYFNNYAVLYGRWTDG